MKKRIYKKAAKNRCMKCGGTSGQAAYWRLKTGRWIVGPLKCDKCDYKIHD
jgi:predicted RNA-binding Zn-ribbon protein involved in translation (DUF1610 family)